MYITNVQYREAIKRVRHHIWLVIEICYGRGRIGMALEKLVGSNGFI